MQSGSEDSSESTALCMASVLSDLGGKSVTCPRRTLASDVAVNSGPGGMIADVVGVVGVVGVGLACSAVLIAESVNPAYLRDEDPALIVSNIVSGTYPSSELQVASSDQSLMRVREVCRRVTPRDSGTVVRCPVSGVSLPPCGSLWLWLTLAVACGKSRQGGQGQEFWAGKRSWMFRTFGKGRNRVRRRTPSTSLRPSSVAGCRLSCESEFATTSLPYP